MKEDLPLTPEQYLQRIITTPVHDVAVQTPLERAPVLSQQTGCDVWLKREDRQPVFSFKLRGAYAKMRTLTLAERDRGVIAASAGNHAQGVALAAERLGTHAVIVAPTTIPEIKAAAIRARGAELILWGDTYDDAQAYALEMSREQRMTFIHAFDDPQVIAGQGTIGLEILRQTEQPLDAIYVSVGGGGLAAGVAVLVKQVSPKTRVIGVSPEGAESMQLSLSAGRPVTLKQACDFADGVAVKTVGQETLRLCSEFLDDMLIVSQEEVHQAIRAVFEDCRAVLEPAGAVAAAGLLGHGRTCERAAVVCSGANINFDALASLAAAPVAAGA